MHDAEVRLAFFKEVGQQADFQAVLEHDLVGVNARAKRIDDRRAKETPAEAGKRHATRLATAIMMYSFGGLRREGVKSTLPPGVTEQELLSVCVGPDLDSTTAMACLKELKEKCLYLHFDGARYCFKKDPNVTLLVEQEADSVARDERRARRKIKEMIEHRLAGHHEAIVWPEKTAEVPHDDPRFLVVYMPLEFGGMPETWRQDKAREFFEKYGDKPRKYRNGLALAVPSDDQIETLRRSVRYLLAIEQVKHKAKQLNLTAEQKGQLRERESTEKAVAESALLKMYVEVWLPRTEAGSIAVDAVAFGGRPPQTTLNDKKEAAIHERVMELITVVHRRVHGSLTPVKIVGLFKLGEGESPRLGVRLAEVVEGFYSFLGFTRIVSEDVVRQAVARGTRESIFGYFSGATPELNEDSKFKVAVDKVRIDEDIPHDEIDLDTGFIMLPSAVPRPEPITPPQPTGAEAGSGEQPPVTPPVAPGGEDGEPPVGPPTLEAEKVVQVSFCADRNALYAAWNAAANLADLAGKVNVTLRAESEDGFDKSKLQNGVMEPLREADLIE
jgi:hypothetical protein